MPQRKLFDQKTLNELKKHPLYSQDGKGDNAIAYAKIFNPYGRGYWYITEYDGDDTFFGYYRDGNQYVEDHGNDEWSYMSKKELENARVKVMGMSMPLERDAYFKPTKIGDTKYKGNKSQFSEARQNLSSTQSTAKGGLT